MATINSYLNFNGTTEAAFNFYKSVFGGEFAVFQRFKDSPMAEQLPEHEREMVLHVSLPIGKTAILMATDVLESMGQKLIPGNNFSINITPESEEEATMLFNKLVVDGKIEMPLEKTFWGAYFGILIDKFGVQWMVNYPLNQ